MNIQEAQQGTSWELGLRSFLAARDALDEPRCLDAQRLNDVLSRIRPHLAPTAEHIADAAVPKATEIEAAIEALAGPLEDSRNRGALVNPWAAAGLKRAEVRNAAVLATLWTPNSGGAAAKAFLNAFLRRLQLSPAATLPTRDQLQAGYIVRTEHCPLGAASERVDITIEGETFLLGIEVKIGAREGPRQLERYVNALNERATARRKQASIVFLAPFAPSEQVAPQAWLTQVTPATWGDVAAAARTVVPKRRCDRNFNHQLIDSFASHVAPFRKSFKSRKAKR